ncbi:MAG: hypothetical protein WA877_07560, partial [Legionella sp.]
DCEWDNLYQESGNNYDKIRLVWRQLIGFEMRRLPGIDRCVMAQSIFFVVDQYQDVARSYKFKYSAGDFPVIASDNSLDGLGGDFAVDIIGRCDRQSQRPDDGAARIIGSLMSNKNFKLAGLMQPRPVRHADRCILI